MTTLSFMEKPEVIQRIRKTISPYLRGAKRFEGELE